MKILWLTSSPGEPCRHREIKEDKTPHMANPTLTLGNEGTLNRHKRETASETGEIVTSTMENHLEGQWPTECNSKAGENLDWTMN